MIKDVQSQASNVFERGAQKKRDCCKIIECEDIVVFQQITTLDCIAFLDLVLIDTKVVQNKEPELKDWIDYLERDLRVKRAGTV